MSQPGLGVMINYLGYAPDKKAIAALDAALAERKRIKSISITDDQLKLVFGDDTGFVLWDNGQSCCERRYMHTDDDLQSLVGQCLVSIDVETGESGESEWGEEKEVQFLKIQTDQGFATVANYNVHNGYYGGFALNIDSI